MENKLPLLAFSLICILPPLISDGALQYEAYRQSCGVAENLVLEEVKRILVDNPNATAQLLRLLFHDCFIEGCDASILLDDSNRTKDQSTERHAVPNQTLKGFVYIDQIKEVLEKACPGVVSCADILALAVRDAIALSGGLYYPVLTGRRDSIQSFKDKAIEGIPKPDSNISETLRLFGQRGFNERETVALLGAHNIGSINCSFIRSRLESANDSIPFDFQLEMKKKCKRYDSISNTDAIHKGGFGSHYYQVLRMGRGVLTADQELMANEETAKAVIDYSEDARMFRIEFATAMIKLSNLNVRVGSEGEVRRNCSNVNPS